MLTVVKNEAHQAADYKSAELEKGILRGGSESDGIGDTVDSATE